MKRLTVLVLFASCVQGATLIMPEFADGVAGWATNRYDPTSFQILTTAYGRLNVLDIGITSDGGVANRPAAYQSAFYNTQGREHAIIGGPGSLLEAALYIPETWSNPANGNVRSDLWGVMTDGSSVSGYPIIGFTNYGAGGARYRVWEDDSGWIDSAIPVRYNAWTVFGILFTGSSYDFFVNGERTYRDTSTSDSTGFQGAIMMAYNFYDPALGANPIDYHANWSNTPEPGTWMLAGSSLIGLMAVMRRRRR